MKAVLAALILILLSFTASASITVDKSSVDLVAGETFILNYTITGTGDGTINISITPDSIGFNLSYNHSFNIPCVVSVVISTDPFLRPGVYTVTALITTGYGSIPPVVHHSSHHVTVGVPVVPPVNNTLPPVYSPPVNQTFPALPPPTTISDDGFNWFFVLIPFAVLFILIDIILLLVFLNRRKKKAHMLGYEYPAHEKGKLK